VSPQETMMQFPVLASRTAESFIRQWSEWYFYPREDLYATNVGRASTPEAIRALFLWKNGRRLSAAKQASVERNYVARRKELLKLDDDTSAADFLRVFREGGAVWRIFWLHCWNPQRFPIYDQHVHRAMEFIVAHRCREIPPSSPKIIESYIDRYLPFWSSLPTVSNRGADKALWVFGRFLKQFPCASRPRDTLDITDSA
jgi:hypothetical protein